MGVVVAYILKKYSPWIIDFFPLKSSVLWLSQLQVTLCKKQQGNFLKQRAVLL